MDRYLFKYVGTYRVKACIDEETNDFPRDQDGNIDDSFADFYIDCSNNIKIVHGYRDTLGCYVPSLRKGKSIIINLYKAFTKNKSDDIKYEDAANALINNGYIKEIDATDEEILFTFSSKHIDDVAKIVKAKTSGASISPLSPKNLPKAPYEIPSSDKEQYNQARSGIEPLNLAQLSRKFLNEYEKSQKKGYDYTIEMRKMKLSSLNFIHAKGLWNDYCEFLATQSK